MIPFLDKKGVARDRKHRQDERENNQTKVGHFFVYTTEKKIFWAFLVHLNSGTFFLKFFGVHMYCQRIWDPGDVHDVLVVQFVTT